MKRVLSFLIGAAGLWAQVRVPGPGGPSSVAGGGYQHEYSVTLAGSGQIPASQSNFTVLVCANMTLGTGNACPTVSGLKVTGSGGYVTSASGLDIVFSTTACSSPTLMKWEMVTYTGTSGAMEAWVLNTSLAAGGVFYMCVDNSGISSFQGGTAGSEWDTYFARVYHLANGSSLSLADSSTNGASGTNSGATAGAGQIDGGAATNGTGSYFTLPIPSLGGAADWTFSLWLEQDNSGSYNTAFDVPAGNMGLFFGATGAMSYTQGNLTLTGLTGVTVGSLHYLAMVHSAGGSMWGYVDGALKSGPNSASTGLPGDAMYFGTNPSGGGIDWQGKYDEIRVSTGSPRSANWITTEYNNQFAPASFMTVASVY